MRELAVRRTAALLKTGALILAVVLGVPLTGCSKSGAKPDMKFSTAVANPTFKSNGPRVLFDEAHHNVHTAGGKYKPFVNLIENDGYSVSPNREPFRKETLERYAVLVISNALGTNERNDDPAFTEEECDVVAEWVLVGGSLLFITDHYPTGTAVQNLAQRFGISMSLGVTEDSLMAPDRDDPTSILYTWENGGLVEGPWGTILGRRPEERVNRIQTFTGQSLAGGSDAHVFLRLGPAAVDKPPQPIVERKGGDVIVHVAYGDPVSAEGRGQGLALRFGQGRVVALGEAAMLTAQLSAYDGSPFGMNVPGIDNRQLALNIMHWLAGPPVRPVPPSPPSDLPSPGTPAAPGPVDSARKVR
jgi:hypothetical protein